MDLSKYNAGAAASPPAAPVAPSTGYPTDGNPSVPTPAVQVGSYWFYQLQAEMAALLAAGAVAPDHTDLNQLADAVWNVATNAAVAALALKTTLITTTALDSRGPGSWLTLDLQGEVHDTANAHANGSGNIVVPAGVTYARFQAAVRAHGNGGLGTGVDLAARIVNDGVVIPYPGELWAETLAYFNGTDNSADVQITTPWVAVTAGDVIALQWYHPAYSMTIEIGGAWLAAEFR